MPEVWITGTEQFAQLGRRMRRHSGREFENQLSNGIQRSAKSLEAEVRRSARSILPRRGGLAARVASSKINTRVRGSGVQMQLQSAYDVNSIDSGRVHHPTYGRRPLVGQSVPAGFWSKPLQAGGPKVRTELTDVMSDTARKIEG